MGWVGSLTSFRVSEVTFFLYLVSPFVSPSVLSEAELEGAEVGVEGGGSKGGGGEGGDVDSDSSDSEVVGPPLPPGYKVCTNGE